jgi:uncharacterized membrane protein
MADNQNGSESKIQKVIYNQVSLVLAILGVAFGIYFTFANPQRNSDQVITEIKAQLDLHQAVQVESDKAIADKLEIIRQGDLKDLKNDLMENRTEIVSLQKEIVELKTIINERLPNKK